MQESSYKLCPIIFCVPESLHVSICFVPLYICCLCYYVPCYHDKDQLGVINFYGLNIILFELSAQVYIDYKCVTEIIIWMCKEETK